MGSAAMGSSEPLLILILGALIVAIDGQVLFRGSIGYLAEVYQPAHARQVAKLATVLFHLVMLGCVALVASINLEPGADVQPLLARVGILLLLTALGHGVTMAALSRLREQQLSTLLAETQIAVQHRPVPRHPSTPSDRDRARGAGQTNGHRDTPAPTGGAPADDPGF
jgi:hypothetical protein